MRMKLSEIAQLFSSQWQGEEMVISGISTDSRFTRQGDLFIALTGQNFDGHDFIEPAFSQGAVAAIVSKKQQLPLGQPVFQVEDTLRALGDLAAHWHQRCQSVNGDFSHKSQTIAITGSVGKTTVKEMIHALLKQDVKVCATQGNYNNAIGLPLTLLQESEQDEVTIVEMGANAAGEIKRLCELAKPDIGIITEVAEAHLEGFKDMGGIARAKAELFSGLKANGTAIVNAEINCLPILLSEVSASQIVSVALKAGAGIDVWAENIQLKQFTASFDYCSRRGRIPVSLALGGQHNILNALLAITGIISLGFDADQRVKYLRYMADIPGRLNASISRNGGLIIDDSYNANPASVRAAIHYLQSFSQRKVLVLGDMGELGPEAKALHGRCGEYARSHGIDALYSLGDLASESAQIFYGPRENAAAENHYQEYAFNNKEKLVRCLTKELEQKSIILIKGSRATKMEQVVVQLREIDHTFYNKNKKQKRCL